MADAPIVSVLITTYNRSKLLKRAINSVLGQTFKDYEIVIVDDCSMDDTREVVEAFHDPRIRYFRNEINVGSKEGDRPILRRLIYELMRGKYFVYLCDDDYWLLPNLLELQVAAFREDDDLVIAIGGQLSHFITTPDSKLAGTDDLPMAITPKDIEKYFDLKTLTSRTPHLSFMRSAEGIPLFRSAKMTSDEFLEEFASNPASKNIIVGGMLYSRELFLRSGALLSLDGSHWQAGYELIMGPACYGNVVYFDQPAIITEIRGENASFRGTQVDHYLDSVKSVEIAFKRPLADAGFRQRRGFLRQVKNNTLRRLSNSFLGNTLSINRFGELSLCSAENISKPVTHREVITVFWRNRIWPRKGNIKYFIAVNLSPRAIDRIRRYFPSF
jgi:glycosyltransferase involved in cell wall biosynthesis